MGTGTDFNLGVGMRILLCFALFFASLEGSALAEKAPPRRASDGEVLILQDRLNELIEEESLLRVRRQEEVRIGIRPYTDYLFHQKSLRFAEMDDRLAQLNREKTEIVRRFALLQEEGGFPQGLPRDFSTYSGAPLLSFYDGTRFDPLGLLRFQPFWTGLFRVLFAAFVLLMVSLPWVAIRRMRAGRRPHGVVRIFPIFTVLGKDGHRRPLETTVKRRETAS